MLFNNLVKSAFSLFRSCSLKEYPYIFANLFQVSHKCLDPFFYRNQDMEEKKEFEINSDTNEYENWEKTDKKEFKTLKNLYLIL